jgi:hypothetical protein
MTANFKKSLKVDKMTFDRDFKISIVAVQFGPERTYSYLCEFQGVQYPIDSSALENFH